MTPAIDNPPPWRVCVPATDLIVLLKVSKAWLAGEQTPEGLDPTLVSGPIERTSERLERSLLRRE